MSYGPRRVTIQRSGFAWEDTAWRFLAFDGQFYSYAATPEEAFAALPST